MKKLIFIVVTLFIFSCNKKNLTKDVNSLLDDSPIESVAMIKISKVGKINFFSKGFINSQNKDLIEKNSIFQIASMTKTLTSIAAMQLVEQGLISLDEPLDKLLPEMAEIPILNEDKKLIKAKNSITLRHLLTHTAGFGYWFTSERNKDWELIQKELNINEWKFFDKPRLFEAGTTFMYGTNTDWVGKVVEKISGLTLEQYFRKNISGPLEMNSTWYNLPKELQNRVVALKRRDFKTQKLIEEENVKVIKKKTFSGGGGLYSSPEDYAKLIQCMLNEGSLNDIKILEPQTFRIMNTKQLVDFKIIHRLVENESTDITPRGTTDNFFDNYDNWTLAWAYEESSNIRPIGTSYWAGLFNTYYTIDYENEFGLVYFTQILPFNDFQSYDLFSKFEKSVYQNL